jgi:hypothetical protein
MALSTANSARTKPRYGVSSAVNEEIWAGHSVDHDNLHAATTGIFGVTFVVGAEGGDIINVGIQFTDADGTDVAELVVATAYLSDDIAGVDISAAAPDTAVIAGTDGIILAVHTTDLVLLIQSEADGHFDLSLDETSTGTWYAVVVLPNGTLAVSAAITFA